jgi:F-type H+-transporting ATPase subunit b
MLSINLTLPVMMVLFLVFAWLMNLVFFRPVTRILQERQDYIRKQAEQAQAAVQKVNDLQADYDTRLKAAHTQAQEAIAVAVREAEIKRQALLESVKNDVDKQVSEARSSIQAERAAAVASLQSEVGQFTELIKRKVTGGSPAYSSAGGTES